MTLSKRKQLVKTTYFWWKQTLLLRISHPRCRPHHDTLQHAESINRPPASLLCCLSPSSQLFPYAPTDFTKYFMLRLPFSLIAIEKRRGNMQHDLGTGLTHESFRHTHTDTKIFKTSEAPEPPRVKKTTQEAKNEVEDGCQIWMTHLGEKNSNWHSWKHLNPPQRKLKLMTFPWLPQ